MGIAPGDERRRAGLVDAPAHDAVREEAVTERKQRDIADLNLMDAAPLDEEHVARADCGEHARPGHLEARGAEAAQHVGKEAWSDRPQEVFLTDLHGPLVGLILPHASAIVSKTCSRTNDGFS